ncbi:MAG TPA: universal stress protein [Solirubrobacteraceae bacterium]|nr:universal stress protein [Solirubrobacteraceae bacterium]
MCGIDDSEGARKAVRVADELAQRLGARLVLVHGTPVAPAVLHAVPFDSEAFRREALADAERILERLPGDRALPGGRGSAARDRLNSRRGQDRRCASKNATMRRRASWAEGSW